MFIDDRRKAYGVEAICRVLPIAPSTYHPHQAVARDPSKASVRAQRDAEVRAKIKDRWEASGKRYGAVKVWYDLGESGVTAARCTVVRLMKEMGIQGVIRGKGKKTTHSDPALPCPEDKVNGDFKAPAPNILWVADFTDVFARDIVGWQVSSSPNTKLVLDALEQALAARNPDRDRLFTFTRLDPSQWKAARTTNAIERLNEEFRRRIKTQTVLPAPETVPMLLWALLASGQIQMRKVDGWETLDHPLAPTVLDEAA